MEVVLACVGVALVVAVIIWAMIKVVGSLKEDFHQSAIERKGAQDEKIVSSLLKTFGGTMWDNYIVVDEFGKSHQIDHILLTEQGVFVVETKNYKGIICGTEKNREWTQTLRYGKTKNTFYSPVKQNATHVYQLRRFLPKSVPIFSCVVFPQADLEYVDAPNVFDLAGLRQFIQEQDNRLTQAQLENALQLLDEHRNTTVTLDEHVQSIQDTLDDIENNVCPRCHGELVLREGKNGPFYGCSNYPKCKFTKKL